jgi:hypothetical protein
MPTSHTQLHTPQYHTKSSNSKPTKHPTYNSSHQHINMELWNTQHRTTRATITNKQTYPPHIIAIQETKLTASKSTKYLQRLFPLYKMIFNNTNTKTQNRRTQGQPYNNPRGGLLTLIHQKYAFPGNITKIPTTKDISPYLQIIKITNHPLPTYSLIHLHAHPPRRHHPHSHNSDNNI